MSHTDNHTTTSFHCQPYSLDMYPMLASWWIGHKWPAIPVEMLPNTGTIVTHEGAPVCAGFVYTSGTAISWIEWIISNPSVVANLRNCALDVLVDDLLKKASEHSRVVFTSSSKSSLTSRLEQHGFSVGDTNVTHLTRRLD